jgi:hypothetical protein
LEKKFFVEKMNIITEFIKEQEKLEKAIGNISDGHIVVTIGDNLVLTIIDFIEESLKVEDKGWLSWWLWESVEKVVYVDDEEINVETLEKFYNFLKTLGQEQKGRKNESKK